MDEVCNVCRSVGFDFGDDGFYYCGICYTRAEDLIDTCTDDADLFNKVGMYSQRHCRRTPSKPEDDVKFCDGIGPSGPTDFGSSQTNGTGDDYYRAIRWKYVLGFQVMLQLQSKGLIQHFNVNPNIIDLHNPIWLRLLAHTRLMTDQWDEWAKNVLDESGVNNPAHYKDLPSYLQFCKDGVFAGLEPLCENQEEGGIMEDLWKFYQDQKDSEPSKDGILRPIEDEVCTPTGHRSPQGDGIPCDTLQADMSEFAEETSNCLGREDIVREASPEVSSDKDRAIRSMKRDMDDNKFVYIPPRSRVKRDDHIIYCRKQSNGAFMFAVHGDYYILLRSCAKACQVDVRTMHYAVLVLERGLQEREKEQVASKI